MTPLEFLSQFGDPTNLSQRSLVIAFAYYLRQEEGKLEFKPVDIQVCFQKALLKAPTKPAALLGSLAQGKKPSLLKSSLRGNYSLSIYGLQEVQDALASTPNTAAGLSAFLETALPYLQRTVAKITDENRRKFLAEAMACLGVQAKRATIVMTWLVTLDHLYDFILTKKLSEFNTALGRRTDRHAHKVITSKDDFSDIPENIFIEVSRSADIISNDVRKILDEKLGIRNSCAHPSAIEIHDSKVINFIEDLVDNVIVKYQL
ncbi:hypothetical protein ANAEL_04202 [Anaerolineales bacterium]|nr:hypothetical protein ANAEL_04202 [Anaerolineales bacterium]